MQKRASNTEEYVLKNFREICLGNDIALGTIYNYMAHILLYYDILII